MVYAMALHLEAAADEKGSFVGGITYDFKKCFSNLSRHEECHRESLALFVTFLRTYTGCLNYQEPAEIFGPQAMD